MCEHVSITLSMAECADIYLKQQSVEYAKILNVSDALYGIKSLKKLLSNYLDTVKHIR